MQPSASIKFAVFFADSLSAKITLFAPFKPKIIAISAIGDDGKVAENRAGEGWFCLIDAINSRSRKSEPMLVLSKIPQFSGFSIFAFSIAIAAAEKASLSANASFPKARCFCENTSSRESSASGLGIIPVVRSVVPFGEIILSLSMYENIKLPVILP